MQIDIFSPPSTIDAAFWKFHKENPQVYKKIVAMTQQLYDTGNTRLSMKMIFEVIRFRHLVSSKGDLFLLNNSYTSRYVRLLDKDYPYLAKLFEHRSIRS